MDEQIAAYVDGEMDDAARAAFERTFDADADLKARVEAERRLRQRLAGHYAPVLAEAVPDRFAAMLAGGSAPEKVVVLDAFRDRRQREMRLPMWQAAAALAATLVLGLVTGQRLTSDGPALIGSGGIVADAGLREALDGQLASAQPRGAPVRIGLSFADRQGDFCRTFQSPELAGIACRAGDDWKLRFGAAGAATDATDYRQASSADMLVMQAAEAMMHGAALDAGQERVARDRGWRPRGGGPGAAR